MCTADNFSGIMATGHQGCEEKQITLSYLLLVWFLPQCRPRKKLKNCMNVRLDSMIFAYYSYDRKCFI